MQMLRLCLLLPRVLCIRFAAEQPRVWPFECRSIATPQQLLLQEFMIYCLEGRAKMMRCAGLALLFVGKQARAVGLSLQVDRPGCKDQQRAAQQPGQLHQPGHRLHSCTVSPLSVLVHFFPCS